MANETVGVVDLIDVGISVVVVVDVDVIDLMDMGISVLVDLVDFGLDVVDLPGMTTTLQSSSLDDG